MEIKKAIEIIKDTACVSHDHKVATELLLDIAEQVDLISGVLPKKVMCEDKFCITCITEQQMLDVCKTAMAGKLVGLHKPICEIVGSCEETEQIMDAIRKYMGGTQ